MKKLFLLCLLSLALVACETPIDEGYGYMDEHEGYTLPAVSAAPAGPIVGYDTGDSSGGRSLNPAYYSSLEEAKAVDAEIIGDVSHGNDHGDDYGSEHGDTEEHAEEDEAHGSAEEEDHSSEDTEAHSDETETAEATTEDVSEDDTEGTAETDADVVSEDTEVEDMDSGEEASGVTATTDTNVPETTALSTESSEEAETTETAEAADMTSEAEETTESDTTANDDTTEEVEDLSTEETESSEPEATEEGADTETGDTEDSDGSETTSEESSEEPVSETETSDEAEASADTSEATEAVEASEASVSEMEEAPILAAATDFDWQALGESTYSANCIACHQATGVGIPAAFPPLAGHMPSLYNAEGGRTYLINVILYGLQGEINVAGAVYNGIMTPWGHLSDEEIAATLNHELTSWGNDALLTDFTPISPEEVAAERDKGLSPADVLELRPALE